MVGEGGQHQQDGEDEEEEDVEEGGEAGGPAGVAGGAAVLAAAGARGLTVWRGPAGLTVAVTCSRERGQMGQPIRAEDLEHLDQ